MRTYKTGAFRDANAGKVDYEGALSPIALEAYGEFMHAKRAIPDRKELRDADNWQLGMSADDYMKSLIRHVLQLWKLHRGYEVREANRVITKREACGGILFNTFGYLYELVKPVPRRKRS